MKKIEKRNRPQQQSKKLELQRETIRRLDAPELESARGGGEISTRDDFI